MKTEPEHLERWDDFCDKPDYSNFDCVHPGKEAEEALKAGTHWLSHPAWDHWGAMWFEDGKIYERVMCYHAHVDTVEGDSLEDVFNRVNDKYGWD